MSEKTLVETMVAGTKEFCCVRYGALRILSRDKLRCSVCGSLWYRIDPKERSAQGRKGVQKRWREERKRKAQAAKLNGGGK